MKSPRPYRIGKYIDDEYSTEACVLSVLFYYCKKRKIDIKGLLSYCFYPMSSKTIQKIKKIAVKEGIIFPTLELESIKLLCYDLCDIQKASIAEAIINYETNRNHRADPKQKKQHMDFTGEGSFDTPTICKIQGMAQGRWTPGYRSRKNRNKSPNIELLVPRQQEDGPHKQSGVGDGHVGG